MKKVNPFFEKRAVPVGEFRSWDELNSAPYDKRKASPYTKTRVILLNGAEFEQNWFLHRFSRQCNDNELRREISRIRRHEKQQQLAIASLKPLDESALDATIGYEQLAVDLTAILARHVKDENVKNALDFALLEDFDHLYRFANLMESETGKKAKDLTLDYTEITVGRPTIAEHRHPYDAINCFICNETADPFTKLVASIITAGEQQTMNFYMNVGSFHPTEAGRKLYAEIAMIEEQHVTEYGSLLDPNCSWLENWLMHEYAECYLYYSCAEDETDPSIRALYERHYLEECGHLQHVASLLNVYEGKPWQALFPDGGDFPEPLKFEGNIEYVRDVIKNTSSLTKHREGYREVKDTPKDALYFSYNSAVNKNPAAVASHRVVASHIEKYGEDYRYEVSPHPIKSLRDRTLDNTDYARIPS